MSTTVARWQDWDGKGIEHLVLREEAGEIVAESVVIATVEENHLAVRYRIVCDGSWRVKQVEIDQIGSGASVRLAGDGAGKWVDGKGIAMPKLAGAIDIDLSMSPFTNTLPIRRLKLEKGKSREILAVYILAPGFSISTDRQRYTCLGENRYRYDSVDTDFTREIEVDANGLIIDYPGLFRRIL
jgi:hypothetical protein